MIIFLVVMFSIGGFKQLTGGRPMIIVDFAFLDAVSGEIVFYWRDRLHGRLWLATGSWSVFRVTAAHEYR